MPPHLTSGGTDEGGAEKPISELTLPSLLTLSRQVHSPRPGISVLNSDLSPLPGLPSARL